MEEGKKNPGHYTNFSLALLPPVFRLCLSVWRGSWGYFPGNKHSHVLSSPLTVSLSSPLLSLQPSVPCCIQSGVKHRRKWEKSRAFYNWVHIFGPSVLSAGLLGSSSCYFCCVWNSQVDFFTHISDTCTGMPGTLSLSTTCFIIPFTLHCSYNAVEAPVNVCE